MLRIKSGSGVVAHSCVEDDDHLSHDGDERDLAGRFHGSEACIEGLDAGIEADCRQGRAML